MDIIENMSNNSPTYVKVYNKILEMILENQFGDKLPPETQLAKMCEVSRSTLRQALLVLQEDKYIYKKHGSGTYINKTASRVTKTGLEKLIPYHEYFPDKQFVIEKLRVTFEESDKSTAEFLNIHVKDPVIVVERRYSIDHVNIAFAMDFFSKAQFFDKFPTEFNSQNDFETLVETKIPRLANLSKVCMEATKAGAYIAEILSIPQNTPLLLLLQVYESENGEKLALNKMYINTDEFPVYLNREK